MDLQTRYDVLLRIISDRDNIRQQSPVVQVESDSQSEPAQLETKDSAGVMLDVGKETSHEAGEKAEPPVNSPHPSESPPVMASASDSELNEHTPELVLKKPDPSPQVSHTLSLDLRTRSVLEAIQAAEMVYDESAKSGATKLTILANKGTRLPLKSMLATKLGSRTTINGMAVIVTLPSEKK